MTRLIYSGGAGKSSHQHAFTPAKSNCGAPATANHVASLQPQTGCTGHNCSFAWYWRVPQPVGWLAKWIDQPPMQPSDEPLTKDQLG